MEIDYSILQIYNDNDTANMRIMKPKIEDGFFKHKFFPFEENTAAAIISYLFNEKWGIFLPSVIYIPSTPNKNKIKLTFFVKIKEV